MDGSWAPITTAILLAVLAERMLRSFICYILCKKKKNPLPTERNSRFSDYFQVPCFCKVFHRERERDHWVCLVAYSCLVASCIGSWGLVYKRVLKADGDVTMREGPHSQQQNRFTVQQTALSFCEKFPLILSMKSQTCTQLKLQKNQDISEF